MRQKSKKNQIGGKWKDMSEGEAWWSGHLRWWDDDGDDDDEEGESDYQEDEEEGEEQDDEK